jgi:hypothetical protein
MLAEKGRMDCRFASDFTIRPQMCLSRLHPWSAVKMSKAAFDASEAVTG